MFKTLMGGAVAVTIAIFSPAAQAAQCGNDASGFTAWVDNFKRQAPANGIPAAVVTRALADVQYNRPTIRADRGQKSFKLSFDQFMKKRGGQAIISRGKSMKASNAALFSAIERRYGVPAGPLLAIWGMETGFGGFLGDQHTLSAVTTLAYDCRRSAYFTEQLYAALQLVARGDLSPSARGAAHGEIGQTQFLPLNVLRYGADGDGDGHIDMVRSRADALASTANFLVGHGWRAGAGYQPGQPNFVAIQGWNAASVYQQAIAHIGAQIDGR
ncbi:lytic transglycosylase domain-containing protein [Rhizobium sp. SSA_523]|uniref:lytic murein transglycosylase n=1 Tax=Rhizobium sp. SSA_523 TaxID=2952477 RepID=UPI00209125FB|nr:lytic transglycosylase domain-containing protein [Rhizobium sp. SSA_523]MCO5734573.1 lytic transglycosylase domain-containing protein [Rhizobium sp. SSA_523]WKC25769.1 lytic transglycosylase domain-containing protein [Rhizobium sp. SSA_523]